MKLAWSEEAKAELRAIRAFSTSRWGPAVAAHYLADLRSAAHTVAEDPSRAKVLDHRFRLFRVRSHFLVVQVDEGAGYLIVARVLHVARDLDRQLT